MREELIFIVIIAYLLLLIILITRASNRRGDVTTESSNIEHKVEPYPKMARDIMGNSLSVMLKPRAEGKKSAQVPNEELDALFDENISFEAEGDDDLEDEIEVIDEVISTGDSAEEFDIHIETSIMKEEHKSVCLDYQDMDRTIHRAVYGKLSEQDAPTLSKMESTMLLDQIMTSMREENMMIAQDLIDKHRVMRK